MPQARAAQWQRRGQARWRWGPSQGRRSRNAREPKAKGPGTLGTQGPRPWLRLKRHLAMAWPGRAIVLPWPAAWHGNMSLERMGKQKVG